MITNCPNCGAPIEHIYSHNCPYCNTLLNANNIGNSQEINLKHIHNIELKDIEHNFAENALSLYFKGHEIDVRPMYECNNSKAICFNKSQEVMFAIKIPINELYYSDINLEKIINSRIPDEIFYETMEAILKFCRENIDSKSRLIMNSLYK